MPEGHTIHRLARDQQPLIGQTVSVTSPQGRFRDGAKTVNGKSISAIEACGKHLFYHWQGTRKILHIHLGLYGKFRNHRLPVPEPRGAVRMRVVASDRAFDLNGPNRCELLSSQQYQAILNRLGPDPLREDADPQPAWERIQRSRAAIGTLLLDQSVIAGVGNIFRAEALFLTGIHPDRPGRSLEEAEFQALWTELVRLLQTGVKYNRIITVRREEVDKPLSRLGRQERLLLYKKEFCPNCDQSVSQWELGARKIFACSRCQK